MGAGLMLQPAGLLALERIGCRVGVEALGSRITRFRGWTAPDWRQLVEVDYGALRGGLYGLGIHRASLFAVLLQAAQRRGIVFETATEIADVVQLAGGPIATALFGQAYQLRTLRATSWCSATWRPAIWSAFFR